MDDIEDSTVATRRSLLRLGAIGASAIVTIRPALAQSAASVLNCEIPVPDPSRRGQYVAADGSLVRAGTAGAFAPPGRPLKGEDVRKALAGRSIPGVDPQASHAYTNYIRRLQHGQSGFTCYASLQMPGR
ncbi:hypothetical protein BH09PSE3_BH09PSE3_22160 [soil metagenome]